mmetsp:Transcript_18873/g.54407  ORF Transcript_18873/g.54407 Transcript_18873/m.54407 type:complete len:279 (-) Transcript_18873:927-1763(-)
MSGAGSSSRQQPKGDIAPAHFVTSVLQLGILPESVQVPAHPGAKTHPEKSDDDVSSERSGQNRSEGTGGSLQNKVSTTFGSKSSVTTRLKCTDGALDALRRCHSEFLSLLASELAAVADPDDGDDDGHKKRGPSAIRDHSSDAKSKPKGGKKRPRNDVAIPPSASADKVTGDGDSSTALSRILNEADVMACMERLGMSQTAKAARQNTHQWGDRKLAAEANANGGKPASKSKQAKKLRKGFRDKDVTAEMIAEQERLLAESARAMKERMAQQKEGRLP